jgi:hypothetical protein
MNGDFGIGSGGGDIVIKRHAKKRWRERTEPGTLPGHDIELDEGTWLNAETVDAPEADCDEARLYTVRGARDMLLCGHHDGATTRVTTVLYADHSRLRRF